MEDFSKYNVGAIVYIYIYGFIRHFGVVVSGGGLFTEPTVRTVWRSKNIPFNQTLSEFSCKKPVFILKTDSTFPTWQIAQNALAVTKHHYCPLTNNCEHFYRRAAGLSDISVQAISIGITLAAGAIYALATGKPPKIS